MVVGEQAREKRKKLGGQEEKHGVRRIGSSNLIRTRHVDSDQNLGTVTSVEQKLALPCSSFNIDIWDIFFTFQERISISDSIPVGYRP